MIGWSNSHESVHGWPFYDDIVWRQSIDNCEFCHHCLLQALGPNFQGQYNLFFWIHSVTQHSLVLWAHSWWQEQNFSSFWAALDISRIELHPCLHHNCAHLCLQKPSKACFGRNALDAFCPWPFARIALSPLFFFQASLFCFWATSMLMYFLPELANLWSPRAFVLPETGEIPFPEPLNKRLWF